MSRCGCSAGSCTCVMQGTDCISVTGTGSPSSPYTTSLIVDPDATNALSCLADGAYVPELTHQDSTNIFLVGAGVPGDPLIADLILDPDPCNMSHGDVSTGDGVGLLTTLIVADGNCVDLSGCGVLADPLTAELIVDPDVTNALSCTVDGAYVGLPYIDIYGSMGRNAAYSSAVGAGTVTVAAFPWDFIQEDQGGICDVANNQFVVPVGGHGWYHIKAHWVETGTSDSFEASGKFYQVATQITGSGRTISSMTYEVMSAIPIVYELEEIVYLIEGDIVLTPWAVRESTNLLALAARVFDVTVYADGTYPCAFEIERIALKPGGST